MNEILYTAYMEGELHLAENGQWLHNNSPITNQNICDFFHRSIQWQDDEQKFFVVIGKGRASFSVEDTAFFVCELLEDCSPWNVRLKSGDIQPLQPESLRSGAKNQFYCLLQNGHRARFLRGAHQQLMAHVINEETLLIDGQEIRVKSAEI